MEKMTEAELMAKVHALGLPEGDERINSIVCSLVGHSRIVTSFFGYKNCARCGALVGDSLGGVWNGEDAVQVGHNCETCHANYEKMGWEDKAFCPDPFVEEEPQATEEGESQ